MAEYAKGEMIYEGKAKRLYTTAHPDELVMEFKDSLTAFDAVKKDTMAGKGAINNQVSAVLMGALNAAGIETTFIRLLDETHSLVKRVAIVSLEVIVRYEAHGSLCRRYGIAAGLPVDPPLVEIGYKNDALHDPFLVDEVAVLMGLATREELAHIRYLTLITGEKLKELYLKQGVRLLDFKVEFGRYAPGGRPSLAADSSLAAGESRAGAPAPPAGTPAPPAGTPAPPAGTPTPPRIILADEVTPDTCRLVDAATGEKLDKDLFRFDLGDVGAGYRKLLGKLMG